MVYSAFWMMGSPTCPDCDGERRPRSRIKLVGSYKESEPEWFYDEDGVFHKHDSGGPITTYECAFGHRWDVEGQKVACGACEFGHAAPVAFEPTNVGLAMPERYGVFDKDGHLIGISFRIFGSTQHLMVPLTVAPPGAISLAWPPE